MHLFVGIFSLLLTVICGVGGVLYGMFGDLHPLKKIAAYWLWVMPAMVVVQCFREYTKTKYIPKEKPKLSEEADALNNLAKGQG